MLNIFKEQLKKKSEIYLRIKARPGSGQTKVRQVLADGAVKVDVAAQAAKGKANAELIKYLAQEFDISPYGVRIISGAGDKVKLVKIVNSK